MLGEHRVLCGDATVLSEVERVLEGRLADMTFTDPPYNVEYGSLAKDKLRGNKRKILNDDLGGDFEAFLHEACSNILSVTKGAIYVCMSSSELHTLQRGVHRRRRQVVDLRDLGQAHFHPWPQRLSKTIRTHSVRLAGGA